MGRVACRTHLGRGSHRPSGGHLPATTGGRRATSWTQRWASVSRPARRHQDHDHCRWVRRCRFRRATRRGRRTAEPTPSSWPTIHHSRLGADAGLHVVVERGGIQLHSHDLVERPTDHDIEVQRARMVN